MSDIARCSGHNTRNWQKVEMKTLLEFYQTFAGTLLMDFWIAKDRPCSIGQSDLAKKKKCTKVWIL